MVNLVSSIVEICKIILNKLIRIFPFIQKIAWKIFMLYLTSSFKQKIQNNIRKGDYYARADPFKIVYVNTRDIVYHTLLEEGNEKSHFKDKVFNPWEDTGRIEGGDWDRLERKFTELPIYKSLEEHFKKGIKFEDTKFFQSCVEEIKNGEASCGYSSINEFRDKYSKVDLLYKNIKKFGYKSQREIVEKNIEDFFQKFHIISDEITVNIGRMGDLLFDNGCHRLSIAKILNIEKVPVRILVRHEKWQKFRDELFKYIDEYLDGKSYYELPHPDLKDIPTCHNSKVIFDIIKNNLGFQKGSLLYIGPNLGGYFCHKFEDLGFDCYALEHDSNRIYFLKKFKKFNNRKFEIIDKKILEYDIKVKKFDIVLALNVFHRFLQTEYTFNKFLQFLKDLDTKELFLQCPTKEAPLIKNSYKQYGGDQFAEFIIKNSNLNNYKFLGSLEKDGKSLYKLKK